MTKKKKKIILCFYLKIYNQICQGELKKKNETSIKRRKGKEKLIK